jgi:hypothetical protein
MGLAGHPQLDPTVTLAKGVLELTWYTVHVHTDWFTTPLANPADAPVHLMEVFHGLEAMK